MSECWVLSRRPLLLLPNLAHPWAIWHRSQGPQSLVPSGTSSHAGTQPTRGNAPGFPTESTRLHASPRCPLFKPFWTVSELTLLLQETLIMWIGNIFIHSRHLCGVITLYLQVNFRSGGHPVSVERPQQLEKRVLY